MIVRFKVTAAAQSVRGGAVHTRVAGAATARPLSVRPSVRTAAAKSSGGGESYGHKDEPLTGITFQPFEEVAPVLHSTAQAPAQQSFGRSHYAENLEGEFAGNAVRQRGAVPALGM